MKRLLLAISLLLSISPLTGLSQSTTGFHRQSQVIARGSSGVTAQVVPYATVVVTTSSTGGSATIYSDPLLIALITPAVVTADANGNYDYYIPLNYCVTETITSPGQGYFSAANVCQNSIGSGGLSNPVTIPQGGTGATTAQGAANNIVNPSAIAPVSVNLTPNAANPAICTAGMDAAQCVNAAAAASLNGRVDATGFSSTMQLIASYAGNGTTITYTMVNATPSTWQVNGYLYQSSVPAPLNTINGTSAQITAVGSNTVTLAITGVSTSGSVATGFLSDSYPVTHTLAIPASTMAEFGPNFHLVCNMTGASCVTTGEGGSWNQPGRNSGNATIEEGPLFNGTPSNSAIGSTKLTVSGVAITAASSYAYAPTGSTSTASTITFTGMAATTGIYIGQLVTVTGMSPSSCNVTQAYVTGTASTTVTVSSTLNPGSCTGTGNLQPSFSELTVTTGGYMAGNLPSGLVGQNMSLWGVPEIYLNGYQCNVLAVSGQTYVCTINRPAASASETGLAYVTPFPLVTSASTTGSQESWSMSGVTILGNTSNTNPIGPNLDVIGYTPSYFWNVSLGKCNGGCLRIHGGSTSHASDDINFYNLVTTDQSGVDGPNCNIQIDAMDQFLPGAGVSNISFYSTVIQFSQFRPLFCVNGNNLGSTHSIKLVGETDWEVGGSGMQATGAYYVSTGVGYGVDPIQLTDTFDNRLEDGVFSGSMPSGTGAPTSIVDLITTNPGSSNLTADNEIVHLEWPDSAHNWPAITHGINDTVLSYQPAPGAFSCCYNVINNYAPNVTGSRFTDNLVVIPNLTDPPTAITGRLGYNSQVNRLSYFDGTVWQRVANLMDLATSIVPNAGDILAGAGQFNSSSGGIATGFASSGCAAMTCTFTVGTSTYPASGSSNTQSVAISLNTGGGGAQAGISIDSISITQNATYTISVWMKSDGTLVTYPLIGISNVGASVWYCGGVTSVAVLTSTWTLYTVQCQANGTTASGVLRLSTVPAQSSNGTYYINYPTLSAAQGFTATGPICSTGGGGYGAGSCTAAQIVAAIGTTPVAEATSVAGGVAGSTPVQTAAGTTGFVAPNTTGSTDAVLTSTSAAGVYSATTNKNAPAISCANCTALPTNPALYPTLNQSTTGNASTATNLVTSVPPWLQNFGSRADGACAPSTGSYTGEKWCTTFSCSGGTTLTVNSSVGLVIRATGAITMGCTINARGLDQSGSTSLCGGGGAGGSGGGAAAGTKGGVSTIVVGGGTSLAAGSSGAGGASSGGAGGSGSVPATNSMRTILNGGCGSDGSYLGGGTGFAGGSTGGALGNPGTGVVLIGASINGTGGVIDLSGQYGTPAAANSTGSGSPGGGGVFVGYVPGTVTAWPTIISAPGASAGAGTTTTIVPEALGYGGVGVTVEPVMTLGVSAGALSGVCTVITAGTSTATGSSAPANWNYAVVGGGGTLGTGTVNVTWSSGSVASCTATAGSSSGYTAATYTTSGTSGAAGAGWWAKCTTTGCTLNQ